MFTITDVSIENDVLVSRVTLEMDDKSELVVIVPVKLPKTTQVVLDAISVREGLEKLRYNATPVLEPIKAEIESKYLGKLQAPSLLRN